MLKLLGTAAAAMLALASGSAGAVSFPTVPAGQAAFFKLYGDPDQLSNFAASASYFRDFAVWQPVGGVEQLVIFGDRGDAQAACDLTGSAACSDHFTSYGPGWVSVSAKRTFYGALFIVRNNLASYGYCDQIQQEDDACAMSYSPLTLEVGGSDDFTYELSTSAIPEPATWALMIAGFGLAGAGLRRRRFASAVYAAPHRSAGAFSVP